MSLFNCFNARVEAVAYKLRFKNKILPLIIVVLNVLIGFPVFLYRLLFALTVKDSDPARILIIRADRIGDMILSLPVYRELKVLFPNAHLTCMASTLSSQLIEGNPYVDSIMVYDPPWFDNMKGKNFLHNYLHILRSIRKQKFDTAIDLRGNIFNFFFLMVLPGIRRRVSFDAAFGTFLLTDVVPYKKGRHETDSFLDILKSLGGRKIPDTYAEIFFSEEEEAYAKTFFQANNLTEKDTVIVLHPGAGNGRIYKLWPEKYFYELGKKLVEQYGAKIIITGSNDEIDLAQRIKNQIGGHAVLAAGEITRLKNLAAVLKTCCLCIGTSTGITHLAAAAGLPVIVLCGPEDPQRWCPLGVNHILINKEVACRPCREKSCQYDGRCLKLITPHDVMNAVRQVLCPKSSVEAK